MARIEVSLPSLLRPAAGGRAEVEVEGETLEACLAALLREYPLLRPHLYDEAGALREHVDVFLNDRSLRWIDDRSEPVRQGDAITVLQAVSGG